MRRKTFLKLLGLAPILYAMKDLKALEKYSDQLGASDKMPVLFLGHGSPMNAIEENQFVRGFRQIAQEIPRPKAILCISAHWYTRGTKVTAMEMPRTIHDFGGFPQALFDVQYPAPGNPELAAETKKLLQPAPVELDHEWGLDHGAWSVIKHLYPDADIPVIQMSIDYTKPPEYHFKLANQLQTLRQKGILIIGSGNIVHNLRMIDWKHMNTDDYGYDWALDARNLVNTSMLEGNYKPLMNYHEQGTAMKMAVPTPDHYLPLLYTLGLKGGKENIELFNDKMVAGSISMTSVKIS